VLLDVYTFWEIYSQVVGILNVSLDRGFSREFRSICLYIMCHAMHVMYHLSCRSMYLCTMCHVSVCNYVPCGMSCTMWHVMYHVSCKSMYLCPLCHVMYHVSCKSIYICSCTMCHEGVPMYLSPHKGQIWIAKHTCFHIGDSDVYYRIAVNLLCCLTEWWWRAYATICYIKWTRF